MNFRISEAASPPAGDVRNLEAGDSVTICRSAVRRDDWAPIAGAAMAAFARGAHVSLVDDIEARELPNGPG